jgi:hypothetical protein
MSGVRPVVRYLVVCEDIRVPPESPQSATLVNLISTIRSLGSPPFPLRYPELCVFLQLTECRGPVDARVEIAHADSDRVVFRTRTRSLPLPHDPLEVVGFWFRIRRCLFPEAGLYEVRFYTDEVLLAQQPLVLR